MPGLLVYIMGPSGAGKDSVIDAARPLLVQAGVVVARRVITRSAESVGEQAVGVTAAHFAQRQRAGEFALHWRANGLNYGIPIDINQKLHAGLPVLINGSRGHLPLATQAYPQILPILISVEPTVLRQRLMQRGRETEAQIEQRLERAAHMQIDHHISGIRIETLDNSGSLESAVQCLMQLLARYGISATEDRI